MIREVDQLLETVSRRPSSACDRGAAGATRHRVTSSNQGIRRAIPRSARSMAPSTASATVRRLGGMRTEPSPSRRRGSQTTNGRSAPTIRRCRAYATGMRSDAPRSAIGIPRATAVPGDRVVILDADDHDATVGVGEAGGVAPPPAAFRSASSVEVGKSDPPPGSVQVGVLEAVHGSGCGGFGQAGTLGRAMIVLRNMAVSAKANYVALLTTTPPHSENGCFDQRFVIRGIAYRINPGPPPPPPAAVLVDGCDPPCSPGYRCSQAVCLAVCNPSCAPGQVCRQDRTCGPAEPAAR